MDLGTDHSSPAMGAFGPSDTFVAGQDVPPGSIGWHVDCSANPLDLRPAVDTILHAIEEKLPSASPEKPLVVLFGEAHDTPAQIQLLPLVAEQFAAQGHHFSIAIEMEHNFWLGCRHNTPRTLREMPGYQYDPDGLAALSAFLNTWLPQYAPLSNLDLMATFYRIVSDSDGRVKALFNDAAREGSIYGLITLDFDDPLTKRAGKQSRFQGSLKRNNCPYGSPEGMAIRNQAMAQSAMDHARSHKIPIIFQKTGASHVLGNTKKGNAFEASLYSLFSDKGAQALAIYPTSRRHGPTLNTPPPEARDAFRHTVVIDGLSEKSFCISDKDAEAVFVNALRRKSGKNTKLRDHAYGSFEAAWWRAIARIHSKNIINNNVPETSTPRWKECLQSCITRVMNSFDFS